MVMAKCISTGRNATSNEASELPRHHTPGRTKERHTRTLPETGEGGPPNSCIKATEKLAKLPKSTCLFRTLQINQRHLQQSGTSLFKKSSWISIRTPVSCHSNQPYSHAPGSSCAVALKTNSPNQIKTDKNSSVATTGEEEWAWSFPDSPFPINCDDLFCKAVPWEPALTGFIFTTAHLELAQRKGLTPGLSLKIIRDNFWYVTIFLNMYMHEAILSIGAIRRSTKKCERKLLGNELSIGGSEMLWQYS